MLPRDGHNWTGSRWRCSAHQPTPNARGRLAQSQAVTTECASRHVTSGLCSVWHQVAARIVPIDCHHPHWSPLYAERHRSCRLACTLDQLKTRHTRTHAAPLPNQFKLSARGHARRAGQHTRPRAMTTYMATSMATCMTNRYRVCPTIHRAIAMPACVHHARVSTIATHTATRAHTSTHAVAHIGT